MNLAKLLKAVMRPRKGVRTTSKVEGYPGSDSQHFSRGENLDSPEFNDAAQGLLQYDDGQSIAAKHLGLKEAPGQRYTGPGYWKDQYGEYNNPTTEYSTVDADPELARLKAHYEQSVMAQDGVANTTTKPGMAEGSDFMSVMMPRDSDPNMIRNTLDKAGLGFDDDYFLSPGRSGVNVGGTAWTGNKQGDIQRRAMEALGPEAMPYSRADNGGNAYQGGQDDGTFRSVRDEMDSLIQDFSRAGKTKQLGGMLQDTAQQAKPAYEKMQGITGAAPRVDFDKVWDNMLRNPGKEVETLQQMIKDNVISMQDAEQIMQQFQQQQQGLIA